ncbi:matrixin family metalloprotease [Sorangium sp. So ce861]|uniref:matrixin family metalloprotease n=1 Tax=Sorangium sp. So ce861 TaxID=3133323 RepID=UPI003F5E2497
MRRRVALAAALGALSSLAAAGEAAAWTPLDPSTPRWGQLPVGYYINQSTIPGPIAGIAVSRIQAGFEAWSSVGCTEWGVTLLGDTTDRYDYRDGKSVFHWISDSWPSMLGDVNSVIGVTTPAWGFGNAIVDADMVFNNVGFCWNDTGNDGCVDTQSIATHEEGHFLGLGHSDARGATMTAYYVAGASIRSLEDDDIEGVCALYPIGGTTAASSASATSGGGGECNSCSNDSLAGVCRARYDACGASNACREFAGCYSECPDDECAQRCVDDHAEGASIYVRILECICGECTAECSTECAGVDGGGGGGGGGGEGGGDGGASASSTSTSSAGGGSTTSATASSSAASSSASGSGGGGGGASPDDTPKGDDGESGSDSGCSCSTHGRSADLGGVMLLGVLGALASRRRRR